MENSNGSCEIVYKTQTHEFSTDASQLLVLVKIFFWQGGGVGHTKKKSSVACGVLSSSTKDLTWAPLHRRHRILTTGPPGKSLLVKI